MINTDTLRTVDNSNADGISQSLCADDLPFLIGLLSEKDDKLRYPAFLLLQSRSALHNDVYPFWDELARKLKSGNYYQRSIGAMLIAVNARWDGENRMDAVLDDYLALLRDERPIIVRQCIQALRDVVPHKAHLHEAIAQRLMSVDLSRIKDTMRRLVLKDILEILLLIRSRRTSDALEEYIASALGGDLLDSKTKKQLRTALL